MNVCLSANYEKRLPGKVLKWIATVNAAAKAGATEREVKAMDEYVAICESLAEKHGCRFVNFQKLYEEYCRIQHSSRIAWDRVHPNRIGATLMAKEFLKACEFDFSR